MVKKTIKTIIYVSGLVLGIWILFTGLTAINYKYPKPDKTPTREMTAKVLDNDPTSEIDDYTFGADFYTETYNALYTLNQNMGILQKSNDANTEKILDAQQKSIDQIASVSDDINAASIAIQQANINHLGIILLIIGSIIFLVYVEKIVNLYSFTKKQKSIKE